VSNESLVLPFSKKFKPVRKFEVKRQSLVKRKKIIKSDVKKKQMKIDFKQQLTPINPITFYRIKNNLSQNELAKKLGVSRFTILKYETRKMRFKRKRSERTKTINKMSPDYIAMALGVKPNIIKRKQIMVDKAYLKTIAKGQEIKHINNRVYSNTKIDTLIASHKSHPYNQWLCSKW
jgi:transcriptional regulator with XRE-family HTH domain